MILIWIIVILLAGGIGAWYAERWHRDAPRWISLTVLAIDLALALLLWVQNAHSLTITGSGPWIADAKVPWIPQLGISFHLAMDGLSLLLVVLTVFLGIMSVVTSWTEIQERPGFFHFNLLWSLAGSVGVFVALDLFLFAFFWEVMLVPMYYLIAIWGHEDRTYAAIKFFIFTQVSGLLMLIAIIALVVAHFASTGVVTFDYFKLLGTTMESGTAMIIMLGFLAAFMVKLPAVPFHTWLPDAHTQAPTAGSVILAGVLLKTGAYGLIRFIVPLFPDAAFNFAPVAMVLGVIGILYGAIQAFSQSDLKKLIAYTSISHLGFVLLGVFAWNLLALQGSVMQMLAHGISTSALFMMVGSLQERLHTRDMGRMGGIWARAPRIGAIGMFFAVASLGMPGLGNFIGEFLILFGTYRVDVPLTIVATIGLVTATAYALILVQKTFHGKPVEGLRLPDFSAREMTMMVVLIGVLVWLGVYPQNVIDTASPALNGLHAVIGGHPPYLGAIP
jgi:NADH-quinone oxidoreductase subunit M